MSAAVETPGSRTPRPSASDVIVKAVDGIMTALAQIGDFATFSARTIGSIGITVKRYHREVLRQLKDIAWGSGALVVGGGTVGVMVLLAVSAGTSLGIEGFNGLEIVGLAPLTGFISASANTRELAPLIAAIALGAQVGCRFTAQIGSMKMNQEIDAMKVMGIDPVRALLVPRVLATTLVSLLLSSLVTLVGLVGGFFFSVFIQNVTPGSFVASMTLITGVSDVVISMVKAMLFGLAAGLVACYKGTHVGGGPAGVGNAVNETVVFSFVLLFMINLVVTAIGFEVTK